MKKIISLLLFVALIVSCVSVSFAQEASSPNQNTGVPEDLRALKISKPEEWGNARWIWSSADGDVNAAGRATATNRWMSFRRDFTLESVPSEALVRISADSKYWLYVNGVCVAFDGPSYRGPIGVSGRDNGYRGDTYSDEHDIAPYLKVGANVIAIQVWVVPNSAGTSFSGSGGLIFHSKLIDTVNENKTVETGDGKWMARQDLAYQTHSIPAGSGFAAGVGFAGPQPNVQYDARNAIDWINRAYTDYVADGWNVARVLGDAAGEDQGKPGTAPWGNLWYSPTPPWMDYGRKILPHEPITGALETFQMKTLADAGRLGTEPYSISADFQMYGSVTENKRPFCGVYYVFAATAATVPNYYFAYLDFSCFVPGGIAPSATPKLTVAQAQNHSPGAAPPNNVTTGPIISVDLSAQITKDNFRDKHDFRINVVSSNMIEYYLDGILVGTTNTIDATPVNMTFGFREAGVSTNIMYSPTSSAEISNLRVLATLRDNAVICDDDDLKNLNNTRVNYVSSKGRPIRDDVYYVPTNAGKQDANYTNSNWDAFLYGENTYTGQRYRIYLPHSSQFVPYIKLGASTEAGNTIMLHSNSAFFGNRTNNYITKAGAQEFEFLNWIDGDILYIAAPLNGVEILEVGYRESGFQTELDPNTATGLSGYFDSKLADDHPTIELFNGGHTWGNEVYGTGTPDADNNFYDELWIKGARGAYSCLRDIFMDSGARERAQYTGDGVSTMEQLHYAVGPSVDSASRKFIYNIADWQEARSPGTEGREFNYYMSNARPGALGNETVSQNLALINATWTHVLYTGDDEVAGYTFQRFFNYLTMHTMEENPAHPYYGLLKIRTTPAYTSRWDYWFDWGNNFDTYITHNVWWYSAAQGLRALADEPDSRATQEQKDWLDARLASIKTNFHKFWNEDLNAYATPRSITDLGPQYAWQFDSPLADRTHLVDDRVNATAILAGLVPTEKYSAMRDMFMGTDTMPPHENSGIYMERYVIESLYYMGYPEDAMARSAKRQMEMVNSREISTLQEHFNFMRDGSLAHGWSGAPMIALSHYATGVVPVERGYEKWRVTPQMGDFISINARVPAEIGNIDVTLNRDKEARTLHMTVKSPGKSAEIWVPLLDGQIAAKQTSGEEAEYLGIKEAYQKKYAVYSISEAGTYEFFAKVGKKGLRLFLLKKLSGKA